MINVIEAAKREATSRPADAIYWTLKYLLLHAQGRANAKPLPAIREWLKAHGCPMSVKRFQQTILKRSRESDWFICSGQMGLFLPVDREDFQVMIKFYQRRIEAEKRNLANCMACMEPQRRTGQGRLPLS